MLPSAGLMDQVTLSPEDRFRTENCCVPEGATVAAAGLTFGVAEGCSVILAVARRVFVEESVALTIIVAFSGTSLGAV
jgi:hypothetical protein